MTMDTRPQATWRNIYCRDVI